MTMLSRDELRDAFKSMQIVTLFAVFSCALLALAAAGCATFQRATDDVPGTVGVGLSISACVNAAFRDIPDALNRERAIAKCIHDAFDQLTDAKRREVLTSLEAK